MIAESIEHPLRATADAALRTWPTGGTLLYHVRMNATSVGGATGKRFNGVKVFSATMVQQRTELGEVVTEWLARHPQLTIADLVVSQSSDAAFHCIAISVFYWESPART